MTFLWCITFLALALAGAALVKARQTARHCARLSESYWELRYEHGQLASRLQLLEAPHGGHGSQDELPAARSGPAGFVPLSTLKRSS